MSAQYEQSQDAQNGLWRRLNSWWDRSGDSGNASRQTNHSAYNDDVDGPRKWSPDRLRILQKLFGDGRVSPWPEAFQDSLIKDNELETGSRILVLGSGPGGVARDLQQASGATVYALDDRLEMADIGQDWLGANTSGIKFDRRDYFETDLRPGYASLIVAPDGLTHIRERRRLFRHLMQVLRPDGRIIYEDFFVTGRDPECPEVAIWSALEDRPRYLVQKQKFSDIIYDIGFDYPEFEDRTGAHMEDIRSAFARSVELFKEAGSDAVRLQPIFVREAEQWNRRLALLQSGEARYYRVTVQVFGKSAVV